MVKKSICMCTQSNHSVTKKEYNYVLGIVPRIKYWKWSHLWKPFNRINRELIANLKFVERIDKGQMLGDKQTKDIGSKHLK